MIILWQINYTPLLCLCSYQCFLSNLFFCFIIVQSFQFLFYFVYFCHFASQVELGSVNDWVLNRWRCQEGWLPLAICTREDFQCRVALRLGRIHLKIKYKSKLFSWFVIVLKWRDMVPYENIENRKYGTVCNYCILIWSNLENI